MKSKDPLDSLLETWQPKPPVPANFRDAVWTRIAAQADTPGTTATGNPASRRVWLAAAAAVVFGFALGILTPPEASPPDSAREAYFTRINPLVADQ